MRLEINRIVKFHLFPNSAVINDGIISKTIDNERILSNLNLLDKNGNNTVRGRIINPIPCGALMLKKYKISFKYIAYCRICKEVGDSTILIIFRIVKNMFL